MSNNAILLTGTSVKIDESDGLQDDDTSLPLPSLFSSRLEQIYPFASFTPIETAVSSSNVVTINSTGLVNLAFTDSSGNPLNGVDSGLKTLSGEAILLYSDTGTGSNDNIVIGKTADGDLAFVIYAEETSTAGNVTGAKLWVVEYLPLQHDVTSNPDDFVSIVADGLFLTLLEQFNFSFAGAPSGKSLLMTFGDPNTAQVIVTGQHFTFDNSQNHIDENQSEEVNTSQGGGPTSLGNENQLVNPGEGLLFTLVTGTPEGLIVGGADTLTSAEADDPNSVDFTGFFGTQGASVLISQLQGGEPTTVKITALRVNEAAGDVQGLNFFSDINQNDDIKLLIDLASVQIIEGAGGSVTPTIIDNGDGTFTVQGIEAGDKILFSLEDGQLDMTRIRVELPADADPDFDTPFDIGGIGLTEALTTPVDVGPKLVFDDDGPSISTSGSLPSLTVDETVLATDATQSFAANFSSGYGADGAGTLT
ncbi:MAG: hypothetical protein HYZ18_13420, partial [Pseudogulbenkiania sp.]|nr:hypothetical protein [Pseudogulbenkiania sp.]